MRLPRWRTETRKTVIFNNFILIGVSTYLIITAGLNLATTIYPELHRPPHFDTRVGCNGRQEYCDRRYDNISQIGTHGSPFWGVLPSHNQNMGIRAQMDAGIRFLQVQTHRSPLFNQMKACHTSCVMEDAGTLEDYLLRLKGWLMEPGHEREVVSVLMTNGDYVDVGAYEDVFKKVDLVNLVYMPDARPKARRRDGKPPPPHTATIPTRPTRPPLGPAPPQAAPEWPTLHEMTKRGQRLVIFMDYGAKPSKVPYILDEFDHFWETPFDTIDPSFNQCAIDRPVITPQNKARTEQKMYILNHYLDTKMLGALVPNRKDAHKTNALEGRSGIRKQVELCEGLHGGKKPRVLLVDYFDVGEFRRAEAWLNGFER